MTRERTAPVVEQPPSSSSASVPPPLSPILVIHGGAGTLSKSSSTPEALQLYAAALTRALRTGFAVLSRGGSSVDAVEAAVVSMEDCPLFNAGKGSVLTSEGHVEMDASVMRGDTGAGGAVAGVRRTKNPIRAARAVMERSKHVLLAGTGADAFAESCGLPTEPEAYFVVPSRWEQLQDLRNREDALREESAAAAAARVNGNRVSTATQDASALPCAEVDAADHVFGTVRAELDHSTTSLAPPPPPPISDSSSVVVDKWGTVGAVARDAHGLLAAATSTGGMTNKRWGRVGDSPILGAGTFARNTTCAVSCTGHGEFFLRHVVAHDVSARLEYGAVTDDSGRKTKPSLASVAHTVVHDVLLPAGGEGGLIAVSATGEVAMPYNSEGMYRGWIRGDDDCHVFVFQEEVIPSSCSTTTVSVPE